MVHILVCQQVMMFYFIDLTDGLTGATQRHIIKPLIDGGFCSFPANDDNPNMVEYLAWVAEGNTAEEWQPESEGM